MEVFMPIISKSVDGQLASIFFFMVMHGINLSHVCLHIIICVSVCSDAMKGDVLLQRNIRINAIFLKKA